MNDELLIKFLLKETSPEENQKMETWLASSETHREQLGHAKWIWEQSKQLAITKPVDQEEAWKRFKSLRDGHHLRSGHFAKKRIRHLNLRLYRSAAAILLLLGALWGSYVFWIAPQHPYFSTIEIRSAENPEESILPDGTKIILNKRASLQYTESLFGKRRLVKMKGEIFFDVKQDRDKPFEITAGDLDIKVLGTSFNVKSNTKKTEVIVETGQIQVKRYDLIIRLKPDEKAIATMGKPGLEQGVQTDRLFDYYRTKRFKLNGTPLWRFVEVLNEAYGIPIKIESAAIANLPITSTFEQDSLANIIKTLTGTLQIRAIKEGNTIVLKK